MDLVAKLHNLRPIEAARLVAGDFGIPLPGKSIAERAKARRRAQILRWRREWEKRQARRENKTYMALAGLYRGICQALAGIRTEEDLNRLGELYQAEMRIEYLLEVLRTGSQGERLAVMAEARGWLE